MRSYDWLRDVSNLIKTISYCNLSRGGSFINYPSPDLLNLHNQSTQSTLSLN